MTPSEYRELAATYRAAGEDANADVCEIMAQEAERLARYSTRDDPPPMDEDDEPAVVMTKDGPQALLPTFAPPPATIDDHTQQLTLL